MRQNSQSLRIDRLTAPLALSIESSIELSKGLFDLGQMLLSTFAQGKV
jgi:hypothetical protein